MEGLNLLLYVLVGGTMVILGLIGFFAYTSGNQALETATIVVLIGITVLVVFLHKGKMFLEDENPNKFSVWQSLKGLDISGISSRGKQFGKKKKKGFL